MISRIVIVVLSLTFVGVPVANAETIDRVAAIVGDEVITVQDFRIDAKIRLASSGQQIDDLDDDPQREVKIMTLLQRMVQTRLLVQEAKKLQAPVGDAEVEANLKLIYERTNQTEEQYKRAMAADGIPWTAFKRFLRDELRAQFAMRSELGGQVSVSEGDIVACARERTPAGEELAEVTIRQILVSADPKDSRLEDRKGVISMYPAWWNGVDAARFSAARILYDMVVVEGLPFEEVANKYSAGLSGEQGGLIGTFKNGTLPEAFDPVFELEVGNISNIVTSDTGFHILTVDDRTVVDNPEWSTSLQQCRGQLLQAESEKLIEGWMETLYERNFVEIKLSNDIASNQ